MLPMLFRDEESIQTHKQTDTHMHTLTYFLQSMHLSVVFHLLSSHLEFEMSQQKFDTMRDRVVQSIPAPYIGLFNVGFFVIGGSETDYEIFFIAHRENPHQIPPRSKAYRLRFLKEEITVFSVEVSSYLSLVLYRDALSFLRKNSSFIHTLYFLNTLFFHLYVHTVYLLSFIHTVYVEKTRR